MLSPQPHDPTFVGMQFQEIWAAFMRFPGVRSWLFNRNPLNPNDAFTCVTNDPEPWSFRFGENQPVDQKHLDNFGELGTRLFHDSGTALGVTFNASNKQPLLPIAYKFTQDPEFLNEIVIVRRCAIRKASPTSTDLLRLQCDWFESGVLGVDYAIIPASAPDLRPNVGFAVFGYRVYRSADAERIHVASQSPDAYFLNGTTSLLTPVGGFVALDGCDSQFQTPCMYCAFRKAVLCHCPAPLRRRVIGESYNPGRTARISRGDVGSASESADGVVWDYYSNRMKSSLTAGTFLTNWRYIRPTLFGGNDEVVCAIAHIVPYSVMFTKTGGELPIIQRVLTTLGMSTKSPTVITNLNLEHMYDQEGNKVANEGTHDFLQLDDSHEVMSLAAISNLDHNSNTLFDQSISHFTDVPTSNNCKDAAKPGSIFFDDAILGDCASTDIKTTSPTSLEYADTELNLTVGSVFATDFSQLDATASRKRYRGSPHDADNLLVKRMQYSILPAEIDRMNVAPLTEGFAAGHENNNRGNGRDPGGASEALQITKSSSKQLCMNISNTIQENRRQSSEKPGKSARGGAAAGKAATVVPGRAARARIQKKVTRIWPCKQCKAVIRGKHSNLTRHEQNKHSNLRAFECELPDCDRRFQTRLNLVRHQKLVHYGRPFSCSNCTRTFKSQDNLDQHLRTVHPPGSTTEPCPYCGGCYGKQSTHSRHVASVHKNIIQGDKQAVARAGGGGITNAKRARRGRRIEEEEEEVLDG